MKISSMYLKLVCFIYFLFDNKNVIKGKNNKNSTAIILYQKTQATNFISK